MSTKTDRYTTELFEDIQGIGGDIAPMLEPDYIPPYGTTLTPADFRWWPRIPNPADVNGAPVDGWCVTALNAKGNQVEWTLRREPDSLFCTGWINHAQQKYEGADDHLLSDMGLVTQWYDLILSRDGKGRFARRDSPWDGDDLESEIARIENNVAEYDDSQFNTASAENIGQLQQWLDEFTAPLAFKLTAFAVGRLPDAAKPEDWQFLIDRTTSWGDQETEEPGLGHRVALTTNADPDTWPTVYHADGCRSIATPTMYIRADGSRFEQLTLVNGMTYQALAALPPLDDDMPAYWWGIHLEGSDEAIVFGRGSTIIKAHYESDGAWSWLMVEPYDETVRVNHDLTRFERIWGRWLDDEVELTTDELDAGITQAEAIARGEAEPTEKW